MFGRSWAIAVMLISAPVHAAPCAGFIDVDDTSPFCPNVAWMKNRSITTGCTLTEYCPSSPVSRLAMAAFMNRLADSLFPLTCGSGQIMKWNGASWTCANDDAGVGGGTVTSISAGTGLQGSPNPITSTGAINLALSYQLPQGCSNGQVAKSNGSGGWTCSADGGGTGTVTSITAGTGLTGGTITGSGTIAANTSYLQRRVSASCAVGSSIRAIAADGTVTCEVDDTGVANAFVQNGNAYGATAVLGTTDNQPLDVRVNGSRVMRYEPTAFAPNVIGGHSNNSIVAVAPPGVVWGATIAGGGREGDNCAGALSLPSPRSCGNLAYGEASVGGGFSNHAIGTQSTVGGGIGNTASGSSSTVPGGNRNAATGDFGTVGGGYTNTASGSKSTVGGGYGNTASGTLSTVGGGQYNTASGSGSTVGGGNTNTAGGPESTVAGGSGNAASGDFSTVAGGTNNTASGALSFAAGHRAKATTIGSFVWADSRYFDFPSALVIPNAFAVRATGGVFLTVAINGTGSTTQYCNLVPGVASWQCVSDRDAKENFAAVDGRDILARLAAMPLSSWNFKGSDPALRMLGPTAQDFYAAFRLGSDDKTIATVNLDGVALAAIQGLNAKLEERETALRAEMQAKDAEIAALRSESDALRREVADLRAASQKEIADLRLAVEVLMARTSPEGRVAQTR